MAVGWFRDGDVQEQNARPKAIPGVRLCVSRQSDREKEQKKAFTLFNRAGSKDSQLK